MEPFDEWWDAQKGTLTDHRFETEREWAREAWEAGWRAAERHHHPLLTLTMPEPTPERKAELEAALASAKSSKWLTIPAGLTLGPQPGPTFESFTADLRAPLNEAGERVGPARERRESIPCVGYVKELDAAGKPVIVYTDERFRPLTAEQREARRTLIRDVLVPSLAGVAAEVQARADAAALVARLTAGDTDGCPQYGYDPGELHVGCPRCRGTYREPAADGS